MPIRLSAFKSLLAWPSDHTEFLCERWLLYQSMRSPSDFGYLSDFSQHWDPFLCEKRSVDLLCSIRKLRFQNFLMCKPVSRCIYRLLQALHTSADGCARAKQALEETPLFVQARDVVFAPIANTPLSRKC